jgi:hypothetical protein
LSDFARRRRALCSDRSRITIGGNGTTFDLQGRLIVCEGDDRRLTRVGYSSSNLNDRDAALLVRDGEDEPARVIPRQEWSFARLDAMMRSRPQIIAEPVILERAITISARLAENVTVIPLDWLISR